MNEGVDLVNAKSRTRLLAAVAAAITPVVAARGMVTDSGDFYNEVIRLRNLAFGADSNLYVAPTQGQVDAFKVLASTLSAGNYAAADTQAAALNYDLVQFTDSATSRTYYELREKLVGGNQTRGWGTFVFNPAGTVNAMVAVPHVLFDTNTEPMGAQVFQQSNAKFFTMAGAQRNANGTGTADVAHLASSVFLGVHQAWNGFSGQVPAYQIHGFNENSESLSNFPDDISSVIASGAGTITSRLITLDSKLQAAGFWTYAYNQRLAGDALNAQLNTSSTSQVYAGSMFSPFGAGSNVEAQYSHSVGGTFAHIETAGNVRFDSTSRTAAANAIAQALIASNINYKMWDGGGGNSGLGTAANWTDDAFPTASDSVLLDDSIVPLPSSLNVFRSAGLPMQTFMWNSANTAAGATASLVCSSSNSTNNVISLNGDGNGGTTPLFTMGPRANPNVTLQIKNTNSSTGTAVLVLQLNTSGAFQVANADSTLQVDCVIQESGGARTLEKTGAGTLRLNGSNTFTGGVVMSEGVLSVGTTTALGTVPGLSPAFLTFNGGTLRYTSSSDVTSITNRGVTVTANGGTFDFTNNIRFTLNGQLTGNGTLIKSGTGELVINSSNNSAGTTAAPAFTGGLGVTGGILTIPGLGYAPASPSSAVVQFVIDGGGTLRWSGTSSVNFSANRQFSLGNTGGTLDLAPANFTIAGKITGSSSASLTKVGTGNLLLSGSNTFGGGVIVNGGTLSIDSGTSLGAAPDAPATNLTLNNSSILRWVGGDVALATNRNILLGAGAPSINIDANSALTIPGVIDGPSASLTKTGTGTLVLGGSNTYNGGTVVSAGVLSISMGTNLGSAPTAPTPAHLTLDGGTLRATSGFVLHGNRGVLLGAAGGTVDVTADAPFSIAGAVSGSGALTKTGTGTLVLDPGNTYTGATTILAGTLSTSAASSVGTGGAGDPLPLTIANNATLQVTSSYTTVRPITIAAGGATIDVTDSAVYTRTAAITGSETLTKSGSGQMVVPNLRSHPLNLAAGQVTVAANGTDAGTSLLTGLSIAPGAAFDVTDNELIIDLPGAPDVAAGLTQVRQYLAAGQLLSSSANGDAQNRLALAYIDNSLLGHTSFGGLTTDATSILLKTTYLGDANFDGLINADDFVLIDRGLGRSLTNGTAHWTDGDFNFDGDVTPADYLLIDRVFAQQTGTLSPDFLAQREAQFGSDYVTQLLVSVPEPSLIGFGVGAITLAGRRRRR